MAVSVVSWVNVESQAQKTHSKFSALGISTSSVQKFPMTLSHHDGNFPGPQPAPAPAEIFRGGKAAQQTFVRLCSFSFVLWLPVFPGYALGIMPTNPIFAAVRSESHFSTCMRIHTHTHTRIFLFPETEAQPPRNGKFVQRQNELCLWHSNLGHIPVKDAAPVSCFAKSTKRSHKKTRAVHLATNLWKWKYKYWNSEIHKPAKSETKLNTVLN